MIRNFSYLCALMCASFAVLISPLANAVTEKSTDEKSKVVLTASVAKPLKAAQESIRNKKWDAALAQIKTAEAVEKRTPQDQYSIDKLSAYVLYQEKKYPEAVSAYEKLLASPLLPEKESDRTLKTIVEVNYRAGNDADTVKWSKKYLVKNPNDLDVVELQGQAYYRTKDWKQAASTMETAVSSEERAGRAPRESWLRVLDRSYYELDDQADKDRTQLKLVHYFKKPADWNALLQASLKKTEGFAKAEGDRARFEYHRLMADSNRLETPKQYEEVALEAMDAGLPAEAQSIIERGVAQGAFKNGEELAGRHQRLLNDAKQHADAKRGELNALAKQAAISKGGQDDIDVGRQYLSYHETDQAIEAFQRGLKEGAVKDPDEAKIDLGVAYEQAGKKDLAAQTFRGVPKDSKWSVLAELWAVRVENAAAIEGAPKSSRSALND